MTPTSTPRPKLVTIYISLSKEQKEAIRTFAKAEGIPMSWWIRRAINFYLLELDPSWDTKWCYCLRALPCGKHEEGET